MRANLSEGQLERLARTLTEQFGVKVICKGDNAWTTDGPADHLASAAEPKKTKGTFYTTRVV